MGRRHPNEGVPLYLLAPLKHEKFNLIAKETGPALYRYAYRMLGDSATAKDMVQEALMRLWEKRATVDPEKSKPWLYTTVSRLCLQRLKESKRYTLEDCFSTTNTVEQTTPDLKKIVNESLDLLTETQRAVLLLRDLEGYHYKEIAEILKITESNARLYLFRARKKIKDYLKHIEYIL